MGFKDKSEKPSFEFNCSLCGIAATVPFEPKDDTLCKRCHHNSRMHIPRKAHNTRVSWPIVCAECGTRETLTYRPRVPLTEVKCTTCMKVQVSEDSKWATITDEHSERKRRTQERLDRERKEDIEDFEDEHDVVKPTRDALSGTTRLGRSVYIRSNPKPRPAEVVEVVEADVINVADEEDSMFVAQFGEDE